MPQITLTKPYYLNRLHETLPRNGGVVADYRVEGTDGPDSWVRVTTDILTETQLLAAMTAHHSLPVTTDKAVIQADNSDTATITCSITSGASQVDYAVWLDNEPYTASASAPVSGGIVTLTLATALAGDYLIEITDDIATGYIEIIALEVSA